MTDSEKAKELLEKGNYTLVLVSKDQIETDSLRGVHPLLNRMGKDYSSYSAADKVIGKGAAFLYILLKIKNVSCHIISKPALEIFRHYGIHVDYEKLVEHIHNHQKDGYCPVEEATSLVETPEEALPIIYETLKKLGEK